MVVIYKKVFTQSGIFRVEMQFLALNMSLVGVFVVSINTISAIFHARWLAQSSPLVVLSFQILTAWAIALYRVYDVRQIFLSLGQRIVLVSCLGLGILGLWRALEGLFHPPVDIVISATVCSFVALWLDQRSRSWLNLDGAGALRRFRGMVLSASRFRTQPEQLAAEFESILRAQCQTSFAGLLFDAGEDHRDAKVSLAKHRLGHRVLSEHGWATPESLERRRTSPALADLRRFLSEHSLGAIVAVPHGSPAPSLLVALGAKSTRWPYTFPEVQRLQNVAELMDNILSHSRLTTHAALKAKVEHLAMMSRGLAHDLKNLVTPLSSFLVHAERRIPPGSAEQEAHAAAGRAVGLMQDYVTESLYFANRLAPRFERLSPVDLFKTVREVLAAHATRRNVSIRIFPASEGVLTADTVLIQRLLLNLTANAIDASAAGGRVALSSHAERPGWIRLLVVDDGCGIAPEALKRIFDPYFTTKAFGSEARGFGLGLSICQKIVRLHDGKIAVQSEPGRGTTVTVDLPVSPRLPEENERAPA